MNDTTSQDFNNMGKLANNQDKMTKCEDIVGVLEVLEQYKAEARLRVIPEDASVIPGRVDLLSNDYLALASQEGEMYETFAAMYPDAALSSSASRLLSRRQGYHRKLELLLETLYGRPALVFNSGYHANTGILSALSSLPGTLFVSDKLIHASSIDGMRLGGADTQRFRHNDIAHLRRILERHASAYSNVFLLAESIYSMDGDLASLEEMVGLKEEYPNLRIILDEAHGFGVRGERGLGVAEELGLIDNIDIIVGTLGKAAASSGAFVVANPATVRYLVNASRSFIFSTAIPPICCAWSIHMIEKIVGMRDERRHLAQLSEEVRHEVERVTGMENPSRSQIIPVMCGSAERAVRVAHHLSEAGYDVLPIRRPTVPLGGERIRLSLNASMTISQLQPLIEALNKAL